MLNTFPNLLILGLIAPTILRITAGLLFARFGLLKLTKDRQSKIVFFETIGLRPAVFWLWTVALIEIISGLFIFVGFLTQISSIVAGIIMFISIVIKIVKPKALPNTLDFYILFFVVFISLIFSGAGLFAFDMPL
ncbi:hypothetical protein A2996_02495 [Candidatus Campbellbacteria bacterium RIFCSPLOWO2_01_FULL_34_15]|jgi:uncharacterized membrane protein YphA (DoxX/SURF4 family)|uniref:DoxX family protein n=2 Tax=Candidatus Campbelliibacteriota TaxID=1752727 RepID=A0A1F5EM47_9BACT|nr:MAG: hypothetical protein A2811_02395 [Candidatus Campbellbacteria bacterium RIFCSPHIGHO2_01_FULL_34_10]OGD68306.1 MAG: hypothetical protein A2996_02495 [Candidatus Campbellbacteria bacterium RIFCSPLOWO2_01_FULL_34_15]